ncbi:unnamed protein product, partial [Lepidochelys olivacea]
MEREHQDFMNTKRLKNQISAVVKMKQTKVETSEETRITACMRSINTALHWAAKHGNLEMAEMVAKAGVDVSAKSHVYTVFHGAAVHNQELLIHLLINTYRPTFWQDLEAPTQKSMPSRGSLGQKTTPTPTLQTLHDSITG